MCVWGLEGFDVCRTGLFVRPVGVGSVGLAEY